MIGKHPSGLLDYFDVGEPEVCPYIEMSTAISRILTGEGFVVAADGRETDLDGNVESDLVQKIFPLQAESIELVYTVSGTIRLNQPDGSEVLLDFPKMLPAVVSHIKWSNYNYLLQACEKIATNLEELTKAAKLRRRLSASIPESDSSTEIYVEGYFRKLPKRVRIVIHHFGVGQKETLRSVDPESRTLNRGYGPARAMAQLDDPASRFFKEFCPIAIGPNLTLKDAICVAQNRVKALCSEEARSIDPKCRHVGGSIHVATVTIADGFRWVIAPRTG